MKALFTITLLFIAILLSGCLGSSSSSIAPTLAFAYVVGQGDNTIHAFSEKSTGDLESLPVFSFQTVPRPVSIALHPSRNFLYVPNQTSNTVSGFTIDHVAGVLTPIGTAQPPTPVCSPGVCSNPIGVAINSGGQFLFVLNQGSASPAVPASISVFNIDQTRGLLSPVAGSPFAFASLAAPNQQSLAISPTQGFLYVSNGTAGTISAFAIGPNGPLTELAGSPFALDAGATSAAVAAGLVIDPKGQFLYAADSANNAIASFNVAGGPLAAVGSVPAGTKPVAVTVDSTSSFVYSANQGSNDVSAFKSVSGALTQIAGSPFPVQPTGSIGTPQPIFLTIDPSNTFLYVANFGSSSISAFGIKASDGSLGLITNSPFIQTIAPLWMVITK